MASDTRRWPVMPSDGQRRHTQSAVCFGTKTKSQTWFIGGITLLKAVCCGFKSSLLTLLATEFARLELHSSTLSIYDWLLQKMMNKLLKDFVHSPNWIKRWSPNVCRIFNEESVLGRLCKRFTSRRFSLKTFQAFMRSSEAFRRFPAAFHKVTACIQVANRLVA